jgi:hypothetical protein
LQQLWDQEAKRDHASWFQPATTQQSNNGQNGVGSNNQGGLHGRQFGPPVFTMLVLQTSWWKGVRYSFGVEVVRAKGIVWYVNRLLYCTKEGEFQNATKVENLHVIVLCVLKCSQNALYKPLHHNTQVMIKEHMAQIGCMLVETTDVNPHPHVSAPPPSSATQGESGGHVCRHHDALFMYVRGHKQIYAFQNSEMHSQKYVIQNAHYK